MPEAPAVRIPSVDESPYTKLLPFVLALVAGSVDVIGFLGLNGLFAAHITGNLAILAAQSSPACWASAPWRSRTRSCASRSPWAYARRKR